MAASAGARSKKLPVTPSSLKLHISHGSDKYDLFVDSAEQDESFTVGDLSAKIEQITGVPQANQKIIYKGKSLADMSQLFASVGFTNNCKLMLLGKRFCPDDEKHLLTMKEVETSVGTVESKLSEFMKHLKDIEAGFLPSDLREEGVSTLGKKVAAQIESLQVLLERLDALSLAQASTDVQGRRKTIVRRIQELLDQADSLHAKSEEVSAKLKS